MPRNGPNDGLAATQTRLRTKLQRRGASAAALDVADACAEVPQTAECGNVTPVLSDDEGEKTENYDSASDDEDADGIMCTVCGDVLGPDEAKYKTTNSHLKCGKKHVATTYHCNKANPELVKELKYGCP
jgi:hypothetical protein